MTNASWNVDRAESHTRLDKFQAAPGRLGSRSRALAALERGKVFLNGTEVSCVDTATPVATGDVVRLWVDRPRTARRAAQLTPVDLDIVYDEAPLPGDLADLLARLRADSIGWRLPPDAATTLSEGGWRLHDERILLSSLSRLRVHFATKELEASCYVPFRRCCCRRAYHGSWRLRTIHA